MVPSEVFLSHSDRDREFVVRLYDVLVNHGVPVWMSHRDVRGAQQWHDEIGAALGRCDWFVVVLSPASVDSLWVKRELLYALQAPRFNGHIVPVLLETSEAERLSWTLPLLQFVDFRSGFDGGMKALLRVWGIAHRA
ncbi:MAG: toll/interleukin-1 receptor domain-containing protein [bacterium]|nr:toll/interleukin-1 receptor domain-containing protein [bacterium]